MKKRLAVVLGVAALLAGCAPSAVYPAPQQRLAAPFPGTPLHARSTKDGFHVTATAVGLSLGVARENLYLSVAPVGLGAYLEVGYRGEVAAALGLGSDLNSGCVWDPSAQTCRPYEERRWGYALDLAYPFPISTQVGEAYLAPRLYAGYAHLSRTGEGAKEEGRFFVHPGIALGINFTLSAISPDLRLGLESGFLLNSETRTFFAPFSLGLDFRF
ncbi:hypothetical protein [Thermus caliditerrae]|uniref:Outer membrane protein beta-barrel domain-containing protein n=1 Tax=Thermus caliditerrae TaxID=1330700 RepID=A0A7C5REN0_9DEIN|nr:hypothetical protein [Thermus caliditerrae]